MLARVMFPKPPGSPSPPPRPDASAVVTGNTVLGILARASEASREGARVPWLNAIVLRGIRLYQRRFSRDLERQGFRCSHYPSCSTYALLAYQKRGFLAATRATLNRIRDCGRPGARPFVDLP
jgi:putative component of membrane protein insertase Oxa1/YidC/SpoIIIJ protein YidD